MHHGMCEGTVSLWAVFVSLVWPQLHRYFPQYSCLSCLGPWKVRQRAIDLATPSKRAGRGGCSKNARRIRGAAVAVSLHWFSSRKICPKRRRGAIDSIKRWAHEFRHSVGSRLQPGFVPGERGKKVNQESTHQRKKRLRQQRVLKRQERISQNKKGYKRQKEG